MLGRAVEDVSFASVDGSRLRGWLVEGTRRGTIVFCPGNSGNLSGHVEYLRLAVDTGFTVLGFDYRGFGRSEGEADLRHLVDDVASACRFASKRQGRGEPVGLFGISLGAASALAAAAGRAGDVELAGVVVEGVSDLEAMLGGLFSKGSFGPVRVQRIVGPGDATAKRERPRISRGGMPRFVARALASWFCRSYPFDGKQPMRLVDGLSSTAVLIVHGVDDDLLPFEAAVDLYAALRGPKHLWLIPHAGHAQEPALSHRQEYVAQLGKFFASAFEGDVVNFDRCLDVAIDGDELRLGVRSMDAESSERNGRAELSVSIGVECMADDGFPARDADERSATYRDAGYRELFRRLVRAVNQMDLDDLDRGLADYLELPRALPFDLLASMYAFRVAAAARGLVPGWPSPSPDVARRAFERFATLWGAHGELLDIDRSESPLAWIESGAEVPA
jgi:pimeloyl-ACP methyl ester carboxylesterase